MFALEGCRQYAHLAMALLYKAGVTSAVPLCTVGLLPFRLTTVDRLGAPRLFRSAHSPPRVACHARRKAVAGLRAGAAVPATEHSMKPLSMAGIVLIVLGALALAYQGITYTSRETVID